MECLRRFGRNKVRFGFFRFAMMRPPRSWRAHTPSTQAELGAALPPAVRVRSIFSRAFTTPRWIKRPLWPLPGRRFPTYRDLSSGKM
jgi:hypothetical protein